MDISPIQITLDELIALEYYEMNLATLEKERNKITRRGALSPSEDARLNAIDAELEYWSERIEQIDPYYWDDDMV
jgi:hypothetical protein